MTTLQMDSEVCNLRAEEERILASFTQRLIEIAQNGPQSPQHLLARFRRRHAAGRTVEQTNPEVALQGADRVAQRRA